MGVRLNLVKVYHLDWADRRLLLEAILALGLARLAIRCLPFRWIQAVVFPHGNEAPVVEPSHLTTAKHVGTMVQKASCHLPWQCQCLAQSLAARIMLSRRNIPSSIHFGVRRGNDQTFEAHAWLRSGLVYVTGEEGHERFTEISRFASNAKS